ncbi:YggS family pyridoxal phosphate-dependent enzyme [Pilimelia columellifera]|uniref:Pyridoxal phosphate homeostasis protein n=1 Tax=Pilimelia columellifera subsp. columellifera TaxID=706583 RepID=A0ABP6AJT4_9ACTN
MGAAAMTDERQRELAAGLAAVRERIAAACGAAGRPSDSVTLIVVTKTYPAQDVVRLAGLGVAEVGENRDQEAAAKAAAVAAAGAAVRWHFIGQLQRNKCRSVVGYADMVHSVDSVRLATALGAAAAAGRVGAGRLDVLAQVSLDGLSHRGGAVAGDAVAPDRQLDRVLAAIAADDALRLRGLMAVAPPAPSAGPAFARLGALFAAVRQRYPQVDVLSAGMSGDLEDAVAHGATHLRIGSAVLGARAALE